MPLPVLKIHALKDLAVALLRAAIEAANADGAEPSPFKGLYIPKHRFETLPPKKWPVLIVHAKSTGGEGISDQVPRVAADGSLHFHALLGSGRDEAIDLDRRAAELAAAICDTLLEDTRFLEEFAYLSRLNIEIEDGKTGSEGHEYDVVMLLIEMDLALGHIEFTPRDPADARPLAAVDMTAAIAPVVGDPDGGQHVIRQIFSPEPSE